MLNLSHIFTPALALICLIAGLLFALLHLLLWPRLTRLQAYTLGLGSFLVLSLAYAIAVDAALEITKLEYAVSICLIAAMAGAVTSTCWAFRHLPASPPQWMGIGEGRLTNRAIALCESSAIEGRISYDAISEALQSLERQMAYLKLLRYMKVDDNAAASVQEMRRKIAKEIAKELKA